MSKILSLLSFLFLGISSYGQLITVTPALPNDLDGVEIIFDASLGSGGLKDYSGDVYAHTGVITNLSTGSGDWKHVKADWGVNIPACKLTSLGNNKWKLVISPSIREYYAIPANEQIQKLAFVFRSGVQVGGSWLEGKTETNGDIFYDVYSASINVLFTNPDQTLVFKDLNESFQVSVSSLLADSTFLYADGQLLTSTTGNTLNYTITPAEYGRVMLTAVAKNSTALVSDTCYYYVRGAVNVASLPANIKDGINYTSPTSATLCLFAPFKQYVFAIGDFNNWLPDEDYYMNQTPDGKRYWVEINNLVPGKEYIYQYLVDGSIYIGDPYCEKVSDPWNDHYITEETYPGLIDYPVGKANGIASVLQTNKTPYVWSSGAFTPPAHEDLMVYELLIRDFTAKHTFQSVIDTLGYLKLLGINAIELMPVCEFEGNLSWGYNPNYYFAVDKYYGPANDFKKLIDICHQNGIAVIMDVVYNHSFGSSPYVMLYWDKQTGKPAANSPFFNPDAKHDFNVGYDLNHESADTKAYISRTLRYWLEEYHVDGFRFDLSKGFTQKNTLGNTSAWGQYDATRINILSQYFDTIKSVSPDKYLILEHFANNDEETVLANKGMMLWGNLNYNYGEAAMGFLDNGKSDFSWVSYKNRGWNEPNLVAYMESHDEERMMFRNIAYGNSIGYYNIKDTTIALQRAALASAFFLTIPGPKMIWQFGEMGYDYSINYPSGTSSSRLDQKPPRWDYMNQQRRRDLFADYAGLLHLRAENELFKTDNFVLNATGSTKSLKLTNSDLSAVVIGNFDITLKNITPAFYHTGTWYEFFTGDSITVTDVNMLIQLQPGEYRMYLSKRISNPYGFQNEESPATSLSVFPNPVSDLANFRINTREPQLCTLTVINVKGISSAIVYSGIVSGEKTVQWKPEFKGLFLIKLQFGNQSIIRKLVVN